MRPIIDLEGDGEIGVVEEVGAQPMHHSDARALLSYKKEGDTSTKYVSDLYLQERVQKIELALGNLSRKQKTTQQTKNK